MDLNFINKDFKNYLKGISKDMRTQVLRNIAEKTDIRVSLKQIGDDALIPLHRLSTEEIRRYESPPKPRNDEINKQSTHFTFTKKYSKEAKQDNSVSSSTSVKENYKHTKKKEETCVSSCKVANQCEDHKEISSKSNRTENTNKPTKDSSTNLYPNKENLKLTLIDLFEEEEDNLKIPEHKLKITSDMKASTVKKILEAKNLNKKEDKSSKTKETPAIPVTPRKRGRPPKNPTTPKNPAPVIQRHKTSETPDPKPKKEDKSQKSKANTSILWKKTVEEYNKVKRIELKRSESQMNPQRSPLDLPSSSVTDRSPSCSPVMFRRHYISDSSSSKQSIAERYPSSESLDSVGRSSPEESAKSTCAEISSTSSSIKPPPNNSSDKAKRRKSICAEHKAPIASRDSSEDNKLKRRKSVCAEKSLDRNKTSTSSRESPEDNNLKRRKSLYADRSSDECNVIGKTPSVSRQSSNLSSDSEKPKRRKSMCADRSSDKNKTPEDNKLKRRKSVYADRSSDECNEVGKPPSVSRQSSDSDKPKRRKSVCAERSSKEKSPSITRQSSNVSSENEKLKRRKSVCAEKSSKDCSTIETEKKSSGIVRQSSSVSPEDDKSKRRKSVSAEKSSKDCNNIESGRKTQSLNTSSEDDKPKRRKSVCAERSESEKKTPSLVRQSSDNDKSKRRKSVSSDKCNVTETGRKTPNISRQSSSEYENPKRRKSVCAERSSIDSSTNESGRKTPGMVRQSINTSSEDDKPKRRKSVFVERSLNDSSTNESGRKTPGMVRQSSEDDKPKRKKSVCAERSSSGTAEPGRKTQSKDDKSERRKSVSADRHSNKEYATIESGRKSPRFARQSSNVSSDTDGPKRKSISTEKSSKDSSTIETGRKTPSISRQSSNASSETEKPKRRKSVSSKDAPNLLTDPPQSTKTNPVPVQKTPAKKLNRSKSVCVARSEDIEADTSKQSSSCKTPSILRDQSSNKLKRRKSVSIDTSSLLLTPSRESTPKRQKCEKSSKDTPTRRKSLDAESSNDYEAVKRRIFSDGSQKYTIPKRKPSVNEETSLLERTSIFEDSVEEELEQIFKSTTEDRPSSRNKNRGATPKPSDFKSSTEERPSSRNKKRDVTPKPSDSFINYGDLVEQMKTTPTTKKNIDFVAPLTTRTKEFSKPSYSKNDMSYDSVLVVDENCPNKILIRRRSVHDIQQTTSRTISRRHSFHFEEPLKQESNEEPETLKKPQRIFERRKSVQEFSIPYDLTIKQNDSEDLPPNEENLPSNEEDLPMPEDLEILVDDQMKIDIHNIDIEKLFPTKCNEDVITLEVSSDENSPVREDQDHFKDVKNVLKDIEVGTKPMDASSEDVKTADISVIEIFSDSDNSIETVEMRKTTNVSVIVKNPSIQSLTTDESVQAIKNYFVSLLYIYDQYYKMTDQINSQITLGLNPNIALQKKYFNKRHDSDLAKLYQKLTEIRVAHFSLIVFFDKLTKVLMEEFKKYKEISEIVIINYLRRVAWILMESFTSPSDDKSLFNCITSYTSVEYLMNYKDYCKSKITDLDNKMIRIFDEISYKNGDTASNKDTNTNNMVQPTNDSLFEDRSSATKKYTNSNNMVQVTHDILFEDIPSATKQYTNINNMVQSTNKLEDRPSATKKYTNSNNMVQATCDILFEDIPSATKQYTNSNNMVQPTNQLEDCPSANSNNIVPTNNLLFEDKPSAAKTDTNSNDIVQLKDNLSLPIINANDKSPIKPNPPQKRKSCLPRNIMPDITAPVVTAKPVPITVPITEPITEPFTEPIIKPIAKPIAKPSTIPITKHITKPISKFATKLVVEKSPPLDIASIDQTKTYLSSQTKMNDDISRVLLDLNPPKSNQTEVPPIAEVTRKSLTAIEVTLKPQMVPKPQPPLMEAPIWRPPIPENNKITILDVQVTRPEDVRKKYLKLVDQESLKTAQPVKDHNQNLTNQTNNPEALIKTSVTQLLKYLVTTKKPSNQRIITTEGTIVDQEVVEPEVPVPPVPPVPRIKRPYKKRAPPAQKDVEENIAQNVIIPTGRNRHINIGSTTEPIPTMSQSTAHRQITRETNVAQSIGQPIAISQPGPQSGMAQLNQQTVTSSMGQITQPIATMARRHMPNMVMPQLNKENSVIPIQSIGMVTQPIPTISQTMARNHASQMVRNMVPVSQSVTRLPEKVPQFMAQPPGTIPQPVPAPYNMNERLEHQMAQTAHHNAAQTAHYNAAQTAHHNAAQTAHHNMEQAPRHMAQVPDDLNRKRMVHYPTRFPDYMVQPNRHEQVARNMEYERMVRARSEQMDPYPGYMVQPNRYQSGIERISEYRYNYEREAYNRMAQYNIYREVPNLTPYNSNITTNYTFNNHMNYNNYRVQGIDPPSYEVTPYQRPTMTYHHLPTSQPGATINYHPQNLPTARPIQRPSTKSAPKGTAVASTTSTAVQQPLNLNTINLSPNTVKQLPEALQEMPKAPHSKSAPQEKTVEHSNDDIHKRLALRNISRDSGYLSPSDTIIQQPDSDVICERCLGPSNLMCSGCLTFYCSTTCQQLAWPEHEKKCYTFNRHG